MFYREYQPNIALLPYIETYWVAQGYSNQAESEKILPDGCVDIVFSFNHSSVNDKLVPLLPNIIGAMTTYSEVHYLSYISMFGIRFRPAGITAFTKVPIHSFTDQQVDMTLVDSLFDVNFHSKLPELELMTEKIKHIDSYLTQKLTGIFEPDKQIIYAVDLISHTHGLLSLNGVADKSCLSLRSLERKFKDIVGISPKTFCKIIKFKYTLSFLKEHKNVSLFTTAIECGYYDHSHLFKEFKALAGDSPSYFSK